MGIAADNLSKEDLFKVVSSRDQGLSERDERIVYLESRLAIYKRAQFGQKRESFKGDSNQPEFPIKTETEAVELEQQKQTKEKIEYTTDKRSNYKGHAILPKQLPVDEVEIHPQEGLSEINCIGKENAAIKEKTPNLVLSKQMTMFILWGDSYAVDVVWYSVYILVRNNFYKTPSE